MIEELRQTIQRLNTDLAVKKNLAESLSERKEDIEKKIDGLGLERLEKSLIILQKLSEGQREKAKIRLEELGTQALRYSLGDDYRMIITVEGTKSRPKASVKVLTESTGVLTDPISENGGGIVDIISIALRLVVLQSYDPPIEGPIILDEPFKMVSKEYVPMLSEFLKKISADFGRQIIMVTHNDYLAESCESRVIIE